MTRSKSGGLYGLPKGQKCLSLIGPINSWFMPNTIDLWTPPKDDVVFDGMSDKMDCDKTIVNDKAESIVNLSYFVYGSIGCFCCGEIYHRNSETIPTVGSDNGTPHKQLLEISSALSSNKVGAIVNKLVDVKNDNSRIACIRFQKSLPFPIVLALTESGTLLIHDFLLNDNLIFFRKAEVLKKFVGLQENSETINNYESEANKKIKLNVTQQLNSCSWPNENNIFLGISLLKEKTCLLIRLKLRSVINYRIALQQRQNNQNQNESLQDVNDDLIFEHQKIEIATKNFASPICFIESTMLGENNTCLVAVAMDDGLITVISMNLDDGRVLRTIQLARHNDQICSMSMYVENRRKFPLGLLASVSRDGLVLIWDIENEFYFADYLALQLHDRGPGAKINWFALRFITHPNVKNVYLAVSNSKSSLTLLEMPENARSKIRLKDVSTEMKSSKKCQSNERTTLKHNALIFNIEFDPVTQTLISSSLDGSQILWSSSHSTASNSSQLEIKQQFLIPSMTNNARTHMLRHNPIKEDLLCLALGKAGLRFHSITNNLMNSRYEMSPSCSFIARKIINANISPTSIAWHPNHEYRLAVGTIEGRVLRIDITPRKAILIEAEHAVPKKNNDLVSKLDDVLSVDYKPVERNISEQACNKTSGANDNDGKHQSNRPKTDSVYSMCWGPNPACPDDITKHAIYVIGALTHKLFIYYSNKDSNEKLTNYLDEFHDTSLPEASGMASEVAWKSNMDMMALGTTDGRVIIVTYLDESHQDRSKQKLFKHLVTIQGPLGNTYIQCLSWHPTTDKDDVNYYKIAVTSNESPAFIFSLKEAILIADVKVRLRLEQSLNGACVAPEKSVNLLASYSNKLRAHEKAITDIAWNPHEPNQLATCAFDRTCYVWTLDDGGLLDARVIAKFAARDRLFTLDWSLVDEDLIYTSGQESVVWAWRPSLNPHHLVSM